MIPTSTNKSTPSTLEYIVIFVVGVLLRIPFIPSTVDDAFITFRYVRNLVSGQGYVFNPGEYILGTTTPLYSLYLALIGKVGLDFILVGKLTNIVADIACVVLLFIILFRASNRIVAWVAALLVLSSPYNLQFSTSGMETGIYTFMILLVLYLYEQGQWKFMSIAGAILVLVRPDGLLALLVIGLFWIVDKQGWRSGIKYAFLTGLIMLPWFIFATWYFGSPIPHSVTAKALTYRSSVPMEWLYILWQIFAQKGSAGGAFLIAALLGTGSIVVFVKQELRLLRLYLVWMVFYIVTFTFFQSSGRFGWYYSPIMPILFTLVVLGGAEWFQQTLRFSAMTRIMQSNLRYILAGTLFLAIVTTSGISVYSSWQQAREEIPFENAIWKPMGLWIRENSTPDATVALESIGGVGWYSERYIWDEGGLVSEKIYELNKETPGTINVAALLQRYHPDFFILWKTWELESLNTPEAQAWFEANYVRINDYTFGETTWTLFALRCSDKIKNDVITDCNETQIEE